MATIRDRNQRKVAILSGSIALPPGMLLDTITGHFSQKTAKKTWNLGILGPPAPAPTLIGATPGVGLRPIDVAALRVAR